MDKMTNQRVVETRIIFLRVGEIDTLNEKFYALVYNNKQFSNLTK
jgi:hypothetical protein